MKNSARVLAAIAVVRVARTVPDDGSDLPLTAWYGPGPLVMLEFQRAEQR